MSDTSAVESTPVSEDQEQVDRASDSASANVSVPHIESEASTESVSGARAYTPRRSVRNASNRNPFATMGKAVKKVQRKSEEQSRPTSRVPGDNIPACQKDNTS